MPVHKIKGGYKWGKTGKVYPDKKSAERQARAIYANGYKGDVHESNQVIRLSESDLRKMIIESVNMVLDEYKSR